MLEPLQKASEDFQKIGKDNYDAVVRSYSELNKGLQAIGARVTDYSSGLLKMLAAPSSSWPAQSHLRASSKSSPSTPRHTRNIWTNFRPPAGSEKCH